MIVYKYRLAAPHEGGDIVLAQMRLAHIYRNTLTEIENGRRTAVRTGPCLRKVRLLRNRSFPQKGRRSRLRCRPPSFAVPPRRDGGAP